MLYISGAGCNSMMAQAEANYSINRLQVNEYRHFSDILWFIGFHTNG
jgi:hypothetical protein